MKKILSVILLSLSFFVSCSDKKQEVKNAAEKVVTINVAAPKAPPVLPILRMQQTNALGDNVKINLTYWKDPQSLIAMVQNKQADVFAFPLTVLAKLYNKGFDVKLLNVNTWGVEAFLTTDPNVKTWKDLKGKLIYLPLKSSPPDVFTHYFLDKAGLKEGVDYKVVYTNKTELAKMFINSQANNGTLIEPLVTLVTMKNPKVRVAFRFDPYWKKIMGQDSNIPTAGIGALGSFVSANQDLTAKFNEEYAKALKWVVENPEQAGKLAEEKMGLKAMVVQKAIPNMGLNFLSAKDAKPSLDKYFELLYNYNPQTIGGKIPANSMYYEK